MRKRRILINEAAYHVTARINRRETCLTDAPTKELFLITLAAAKDKYGFTVDNFVIMENHIHLLIIPHGGGTLSEIMRWLLGNFAKKYNKQHGLCGHLWGDRFYSRPIININDYMVVSKYIDDNPVKANLVKHPNEWSWSGITHRMSGRIDIVSNQLYQLLPFFSHQSYP
jgi:REP element-mobilizing transposase RayT